MNYKDQIIIDGLQYSKWDREYFEFLQKSGITAVHVTLVYHEMSHDTIRLFGTWEQFFAEHSDIIMQVTHAQDIEKAKKTNKVGIFFGAQNCSPIEDDITLIPLMRKLGLLIMQLTYNNQSLLATGCYESKDSGVTRFGKQAIAEMNRVGMIIDMSHSAEQSTLEAIDISTRPICISHSNPKFACKALRNKSDTVIKALTAKGGLLGFSLYPFHLPDFDACSIETFCTMVADTAKMVGTSCLSIGSDLCRHQPQSTLEWIRNGRWSKKMDYGEGSANNSGWPAPLPWFSDEQCMENIFNNLCKLGFHDKEVQGIMGTNLLNFLKKGTVSQYVTK